MIMGLEPTKLSNGKSYVTRSVSSLSGGVALIANASSDQSVKIGTKVLFDGSHSSGATNSTDYTWSFEYDGNEVKMHGVTPNYTFEKAGKYTITLNVTDGAGHFDTDQMIVRVTTEGYNAASLLYSGGAATVVAALLVVLFFVLKRSKNSPIDDESDDGSEEEFEDTIDEPPAKDGNP